MRQDSPIRPADRPRRRAIGMAGLAAITSIAACGRAATLYDTTAVTGKSGYFFTGTSSIGAVDNLQTISFDTSSNPSASGVNVTALPAIGVRVSTVPTGTPTMLLRFYTGVNNTPASGVDALAGATQVAAVTVALPATTTGYQTYSLSGLNLNLPTTVSVRETIYTDATLSTEEASNGGVFAQYIIGDPSVGAATAYSFADGTVNHGPLDGKFTSTEEAYLTFDGVTNNGPENLYLQAAGTLVPEPAGLGLCGIVAVFAGRRRRA